MNVQVQRVETAAEKQIAEEFAARKDALVGGKALVEAREAAFSRFSAIGLPHRRIEEWKYTDIRTRLREVPQAGETQVSLPGAQDGVSVQSLADALSADGEKIAARVSERFKGFESPLLDLNEAFASAGAVVDVAAGANVAEPVRVEVANPADKRSDSIALYTVGEGAEVTIIEKDIYGNTHRASRIFVVPDKKVDEQPSE